MTEVVESVPPDDVILGSELEQVKGLAVNGDSSASKRLWRFYSLVENNLDEWRFWLRLAAEQGDCRSIVDLAKALIYVDKNQSSAADWARKANVKGCDAELSGEEKLRSLIFGKDAG